MDRNIKQMNERGYGVESLSARRAWIEIEAFVSDFKTFFVSLSARRAWIEMFLSMGLDGRFKSLSARRAWIEIFLMYQCLCKEVVALRKESVDRNIWVDKTQSAPRMSLSARRAWIEIPTQSATTYGPIVALRKESVDRNNFGCLHYNITVMVALRKESVDRNPRRQQAFNAIDVALRKESVDRNC